MEKLIKIPTEEAPPQIQRAVRLLNRALELDPVAVSNIFTHEVSVNESYQNANDDIGKDLVYCINDGKATISALGFIGALVNSGNYVIYREMPNSDSTKIDLFGVFKVEYNDPSNT